MVGLVGHTPKTGLTRFLDATDPTVRRRRRIRRLPEQHALPLRLTVEQLSSAVDAYEGGASSRELAALLGISKTGVLELLRASGVSIRVRPSLTDTQIDEAVALYQSGLLLREIGEQLGVSRDCVRLALKARGVRLRPGLGGRDPRRRL